MPDMFLLDDAVICGCDEAGRGCLAGPVVAAAVILPKDFEHPLLNDSKKVSAVRRALLKDYICEYAISYGIGVVDHQEIDRINILKASILAMHRAIDQLRVDVQHIIVDGNRFTPYQQTPHSCFIKGDSRFTQIAAASILAKTHRDEMMLQLHEHFPQYQWQVNKGYPTVEHRKAIAETGPSPYHRMSFKLLKDSPPSLFDVSPS
jgi:ribonuclease HII